MKADEREIRLHILLLSYFARFGSASFKSVQKSGVKAVDKGLVELYNRGLVGGKNHLYFFPFGDITQDGIEVIEKMFKNRLRDVVPECDEETVLEFEELLRKLKEDEEP